MNFDIRRGGFVQPKDLPPNYKWGVLAIMTLGVLMVSIDLTIVILALPDIMEELHSNLIRIIWVLMAYIFMSTVLLLALGRVADIYGRVRLYNLGFALFTVGSALCGYSGTDWQLIGSRVFQGTGGALMLVNSWAILTETFPPNQRGMAMGINSMVFGAGGIVGPVLGGLILSFASWRWIFFINIPIGVIGTIAGYLYIRELTRRRTGESLDVLGAAVFTISLLALLLALTQSIEMGVTSSLILVLFALFLAGLLFFLVWEKRSPCPALDLRLFANRLYTFSVLAASFQSLAIFAVQFLVIFYLQAVKDQSPLSAALHLLPMPLGLMVLGPISGRISDKIGARLPATLGVLLQALGVYWLSTVTMNSEYLHVAVGLGLTGIGGGLFFSPNTSAAMGAAERTRLGVAAATLSTLRNTGMVTSFALSLAVAAKSIPHKLMMQLFVGTEVHLKNPVKLAYVSGMETALHVSVLICLLAAALSLVRGPEVRKSEHEEE